MNRDKELYKQLRTLAWDDLWINEVPRFNAASAKERLERVAVARAVAVVFSESGPREQLPAVKEWLRSLLNDPQEKIRRYAIAALPKLGGDAVDEKQLLKLSQKSASDREKKHLANALGKIGGTETLRHAGSLPSQTIQRVRASVTRAEMPSAIKLDAAVGIVRDVEVLLHCRAGLETFVRDEAESLIRSHKKFSLVETKTALVLLKPIAPFTIAEIFSMRCFDEFGFNVGVTRGHSLQAIAELVTSPKSVGIFRTLTDGPVRYRLDFVGKGHQRAAVRELGEIIYARNPDLINGGGDTPWTVRIHSVAHGRRIELVPKILPDPRFAYRRRDIPAASHPPLAASMAWLAESSRGRSPSQTANTKLDAEVVWDPFCGSGLEVIERCLLGGVRRIVGTDLSPEALEIAEQNFAAAKIQNVETQFICSDFRNFDPGAGEVTLIITNPPLGRRVPIPNLRRLIDELFQTAARVLVHGGRLVFANPFGNSTPPPGLRREFSQLIDFGGFHCRLEKYSRI